MNDHFDGFLPGKQPAFTVPSAFIAELLPLIDDLAELKVTLYYMWAIQQREGRVRYLRRQDFLKDGDFMAGLAGMDFEPGATLDAALERACTRGTLIRAEVMLAGEAEPLYFINTELGRAGVEQIQRGRVDAGIGRRSGRDHAGAPEYLPALRAEYRSTDAADRRLAQGRRERVSGGLDRGSDAGGGREQRPELALHPRGAGSLAEGRKAAA